MNQLGDLLFSIPVLKAAKQELKTKIYSVVRQDLSPLLISSNLTDKIVPKDKKLINNLRKETLSMAIFFSESPRSLITAYLLKIKERIGFETSSLNFLLTKKIRRIGVPSLFNNRELGIGMGLKTVHADYTNILKIPLKNLNYVKQWFTKNRFNISKTIVISIGASKKRQSKCLEKNKWIKVIDILSEKGFNCILTGAEWEKKILKKISVKCKIKPKLFHAKNGILDNAALLKISPLFVGIDSGALHLAAAVGTKCVAIFCCTDPLQIGPMPLEKHVIIKKNNMSEITIEDIVSKVKNSWRIKKCHA
jgi:ADP-heptose:LPS heptosyltransferase